MADETASKLALLKLKREELELEVLEDQVMRLKHQKLAAEQDRRRQEQDIKHRERHEKYRQGVCTHRKGGKGRDALVKGNDSNYAVWVNTYPAGEVVVLCSRCDKEWRAPDPALKKVDPKLYKELLVAYQEALAFPTDNEPSGKRLFLIERVA